MNFNLKKAYVCSGVSIISNVAMMVDRSIGLTWPLKREKFANSKRYKGLIMSFVIGFPLLISSPIGLFYKEYCGMCMPIARYNQVRNYYKIVLFLILYLIPATCRLDFLTWKIIDFRDRV